MKGNHIGGLNLGLFLVLMFWNTGCVYRHWNEIVPVPPCVPSNPISFATTVQPIISSHCAVPTCHNGSNSSLSYLNTFKQVQGNSSDIITQLSNHAMPPANMPQLSSVQLAELQCWISQGAKNP